VHPADCACTGDRQQYWNYQLSQIFLRDIFFLTAGPTANILSSMTKTVSLFLLGIGAVSLLSAAVGAPEIDPATGGSALALLAGAALVFRGRRRN
jgi:hypothetical protein